MFVCISVFIFIIFLKKDESNFSNDDALIELKNVYGNKSETVLQSLRDNGCGILEINGLWKKN